MSVAGTAMNGNGNVGAGSSRTPLYLFLDVDGVLNKESDWKIPFSLDKSCVKALADFAAGSKRECRIVLISTWRAGAAGAGQSQAGNTTQYDRLCRMLEEVGLRIFDSTPLSDKGRQAEVEFYIRRNQVKEYLVIDDDLSLYDDPDRLCIYVPDYRTGFTQKDGKKAGKLLRKK